MGEWASRGSQASLLTSLFPPSGDSSKKPTRECESLSELKVTLACLCRSLCWGLRGGGWAAAEHGGIPTQADAPSSLSCCGRAHHGPPDPVLERGASGAWTRWWVMHVGWGCGCMALQLECLRMHPGRRFHVAPTSSQCTSMALKLCHGAHGCPPPSPHGQCIDQACCTVWLFARGSPASTSLSLMCLDLENKSPSHLLQSNVRVPSPEWMQTLL